MRFGWMTVALALAGPAFAGSADDVCAIAAADAAAKHDVPYDLMMAVGRVESGRDTALGLMPWPWTINAAGDGAFFDSRKALKARAEELIAAKADNFDLGCFQVNYGWHGENFASLDAMLDPATNAEYAALLLRKHFEKTGDWIEAAGAYHSLTGDKAKIYKAKITAALNIPGVEPTEAAPEITREATITAPEADWFLADDQPPVAAMGSLVKLACRGCEMEP